ncbi:DUF3958 family protein [Streptococcus caballi]|uniref:DUF3958 family protein n=1 Tax=Streptococcus caballi TaxID=439220 RepID=UPI00035F6E31|nr:DUF3958 family protein [Streptococcus caballi]
MVRSTTEKEKRWDELNRLEQELSEKEYDLRHERRLLKEFEADYGYAGSLTCRYVEETATYFQGSQYANQIACEEETVHREFYTLMETLAEQDQQLQKDIGRLEDEITQVILDKRRLSLED